MPLSDLDITSPSAQTGSLVVTIYVVEKSHSIYFYQCLPEYNDVHKLCEFDIDNVSQLSVSNCEDDYVLQGLP